MDITTLNLVLSAVACLGSVFGVIGFVRSCRKPKARLRFANGKTEVTFSPHYCRSISTKYYVGPINDGYDASAYQGLIEKYNRKLREESEFVLSFRLENTGKLQLENYRVEIQYDKGIHNIGVMASDSLMEQQFVEFTNTMNGISVLYDKSLIEYAPIGVIPLNQKDKKEFSVRFSPDPNVERIVLKWRISAKDFHKEGKLYINLTPRVDELDDIYFKNCERDVPEGGYLIEDLMPYIKKMQKLVFDNK